MGKGTNGRFCVETYCVGVVFSLEIKVAILLVFKGLSSGCVVACHRCSVASAF